MEQLPVDLKVLVLFNVDNFAALYNVIRVSKSMYAAFLCAQNSLLSNTLRKSVDPRILYEALLVRKSAMLPNYELATALDFIKRECLYVPISYAHRAGFPFWPRSEGEGFDRIGERLPYPPVLDRDIPRYPAPGTADFRDLARLLALLEWFTHDLNSTYKLDKAILGRGPLPLYAEEKSRIYRALCRFEIHRSLFRSLHESGQLKESESQPSTWMAPPWEIEESACLRDYLLRRLAVINNLIVTKLQFHKRFEMCYLWSNPDKDCIRTNRLKEFCLAHGLKFVQELLNAKNDEHRLHLMESDLGTLDENWEFFFSGHHYVERAVEYMVPLYAGRDESDIRGPNAGWRSTYVDWDVFAAGASDTFDRRRWFYCVCARSRLDSMLSEDFLDFDRRFETVYRRWPDEQPSSILLIEGAKRSANPKQYVEEYLTMGNSGRIEYPKGCIPQKLLRFLCDMDPLEVLRRWPRVAATLKKVKHLDQIEAAKGTPSRLHMAQSELRECLKEGTKMLRESWAPWHVIGRPLWPFWGS